MTKGRLDTITNIAILVFILGVGGLYVRNALHPPVPPTPANARQQVPQLKIGEQLPALAGYDWHAHGRTLVLALRNGCHYCEESAPFYKKLADMEKSGQIKDFHIVAIFTDKSDVMKKALDAEGLRLQAIPSIPLLTFKVSGTPTAILADQGGHVIKEWTGELDSGRQQVLLDTLQASPRI